MERREAVEGPLRGVDGLLPHRPRPALHPEPRIRRRARANGINDRTQVVVADAFKDDNSFFSPATRKIKYGSGGVDDAEDADVILHEYGHAIQDDQVPAVRGRQSGRIDRRGLRRLLGGRDVLPRHRARPTGTTSASSTGTASPGEGSSPRSTASAAGARTATTPAGGPGQLPVRDPLRRRGLVERPVGPARPGTGSAPRPSTGSCSPPSSCTRRTSTSARRSTRW